MPAIFALFALIILVLPQPAPAQDVCNRHCPTYCQNNPFRDTCESACAQSQANANCRAGGSADLRIQFGQEQFYQLGQTWTNGAGYRLAFQNGELQLFDLRGDLIWNSKCYQYGADLLILTEDGEVLMMADVPVWSTGTAGRGDALVLRASGDLVVVDPDGDVAWSSGTSGGRANLFGSENCLVN